MTRDDNKNIRSITYNHLNLPTKIVFQRGADIPSISYLYTATGKKIAKTVDYNSRLNVVYTLDYLDGFQYESGKLLFFSTTEGYVKYTVGVQNPFDYVFNYTDHLGNIRLSYGINPATGLLKKMEENNYYPFGFKHGSYNTEQFVIVPRPEPGPAVSGKFMKQKAEPLAELLELPTQNPTFVSEFYSGYSMKYNGKELQNELDLNVYDYGARMYDPAKVRWDVTDGKAELYYSSSPYVYASNTPVQAVDPDGNLVIFINGMHSGDGGKSDYWRTYETVRYMSGTNSFMGFSYHTYGSYQRETSAFDRSVMDQLGDHNALYRDGSTGGSAGIMTDFGPGAGNIIASNRINSGYNQGQKDAKTIIENLARDKTTGEIVETIKIITHSMGSAYGKGYVKALQEYIKTLPKEQQYQIKITLVADFEPYQAGSLKANKNIFTEQFTNIGGLADERQEGLNDSNYHENSTQTAHSITTFFGNINSLQEGTYKWNGSSWECTTCKK